MFVYLGSVYQGTTHIWLDVSVNSSITSQSVISAHSSLRSLASLYIKRETSSVKLALQSVPPASWHCSLDLTASLLLCSWARDQTSATVIFNVRQFVACIYLIVCIFFIVSGNNVTTTQTVTHTSKNTSIIEPTSVNGTVRTSSGSTCLLLQSTFGQ